MPCPGFPGNCAKMCDGRSQCPDHWDELVSTCKSHQAQSNQTLTPICSKKDGLYQRKDQTKCLRSEQVCNSATDCPDGSDEDSDACKDKCKLYTNRVPLHRCDNDSCIFLRNACSAQKEPLCKDGKCYFDFKGIEDP